MTMVLGSGSGRTQVTAQPLPVFEGESARGWQHQYSRWLVITDSMIVCIAVALAQYVRFGDSAGIYGHRDHLKMTLFSLVFIALWLTCMSVFHTRSLRVIGSGIEEYRRIASASFWTFGIIAMVTLLARTPLARGYLAVALPVGFLGLLAGRASWRYYVSGKRANGGYQTRVLAIGDRIGGLASGGGTDPQLP